jgi:DNA polymerase III subunit delta
MDFQQLIRDARRGKFNPIHLIVGTERLLAERAVNELQRAVLGGANDPFNREVFSGKGLDVSRLLEAVKTLPMMGQMRFVLLRGLDLIPDSQLESLKDYFESPAPTTCLVCTAEKLDGRLRLAKIAKDRGFWTEVAALKGNQIRGFLNAEAELRGHALAADAAEALLDAIGNDLDGIDDGLERLSLFVGPAKPITLEAVRVCISRSRVESVWSLVDSVGMRDARAALQASNSLLADGEPALRLLGMIARQIRMVARMRHALASGMPLPDAAKAAGAPPFKARELAQSAKNFNARSLSKAFRVLSETDRSLKNSRLPPDTILQAAILELVNGSANPNAR